MKRTLLAASLVTLPLLGCVEENDAPEGLRQARAMGGAKVLFDLDARPLPKIPFPNDVATRIDPSSPTGKRVNISTMAVTDLESGVREKANKLDGFSTYGAMWVQFDSAIDVQNILDRHKQPVPDFSDDAVYLVNVDPQSPEYGTFHLLDLGSGNFPATMRVPTKYFDFDTRVQGTNLLFESVTEVDENGDGILDPLEDTDDDGVWDTPNTLHPNGDPLAPGQMLDFYERESHTLLIRTTEVLRPATRYAVVLTSALVDANGVPVDSPFEFINHTRQTEDLEPLREILPKAFPERFDDKLSKVRFAWSFTTQTTTFEMEQLRAGLYGHGPLGWMASQFPADLKLIHGMQSDGADEQVLVAPVRSLINVLLQVFADGEDPETVEALQKAGEEVAYVVGGSFETPYFLIDKDGMHGTADERARNENTYDDDEVFEIDFNTGDAVVGSDEVTWWCMVPSEKEGRKPPYPVVLYGHGYGSSRLEGIGFAAQMAKFGLATCSMDNAGHGLPVDRFLKEDNVAVDPEPLLDNIGLGNMVNALNHGRHRDVTNDGLLDPGGDYWVADVFHTRDNVRQTTLDYMQFIRIMRSWDGQKRWPDSIDEDDPYIKARRDIVAGWDTDLDGEPEIAGDFNGDGIVDFGGPQPYYAWGQSLGGIQSAVLVAVEPLVRAAAPTAGGAGLGDIGVRSSQGGVPEAVMLPIFGPVVLGRPVERYNPQTDSYEWSGTTQLEFLISDAFEEAYVPFARVELEHGDRIVYRNLRREERTSLIEEGTEQATATVRNGVFRVGLAGDALSGDERRYRLGFDPNNNIRDLLKRQNAPQQGLMQSLYLKRNTNDLHEDGVVVPTIDFEWAEGTGPEGVRPSEHTIVWEGMLTAPTAEPYVVRAETIGRTRVYFDGRRRINVTNGDAEWRLSLSPEKPVHVRIEYERQAASGSTRLTWATTGGDQVVIPASAWMTHQPLTADEADDLPKHRIENAREFGDPLVIEIRDAGGELKRTIDTFELDAFFQNVHYPAGTPLANIREGYGLARQTPAFRRFLGIAQLILDKADPGSYAPHYFREPLQFPYEEPAWQDGASNVLVVPTSGDSAVPINTGISIARIAGIVDARNLDPRYGKTTNQFIIDSYVYEGINWLDRHPGYPGTLFDIDDLDGGRFQSTRYPERGTDANPDADPPVRATVRTPRGISAMRIPYTRVDGEHGFGLPVPSLAFDIHSFMANQIAYYFATGGEVLSDDPCMEELSMEGCTFFQNESWERPDIR